MMMSDKERGERRGGLWGLLRKPQVYNALQELLGARRVQREFVRDFVQAERGANVCDIGCGPGDLLEFLGDVQYVGIDYNDKYIQNAQSRFGARGRFLTRDATRLDGLQSQAFAVAIGLGLLHHLDDDKARRFLSESARILTREGRLVTIDPCFTAGQGILRRLAVQLDRGPFIRSPAELDRLARRSFRQVSLTVRHDWVRIPWSHCVMVCGGPIEQTDAERAGSA
jgi:SAM-dependent methyltransferase